MSAVQSIPTSVLPAASSSDTPTIPSSKLSAGSAASSGSTQRSIPRVIPTTNPLTFIYRKPAQASGHTNNNQSSNIAPSSSSSNKNSVLPLDPLPLGEPSDKSEDQQTMSPLLVSTLTQQDGKGQPAAVSTAISHPQPIPMIVDQQSISVQQPMITPPTRIVGPPPPFIPSTDIINDSLQLSQLTPSFKNPSYIHRHRQHGHSGHPNQYRGKYLNTKQIITQEQYQLYPPHIPAYPSLRSSPSIYPAKKYCDITHLPTTYTDPQTRLHFLDAIRYRQIHSMNPEEIRARLDSRKAQRMEI